MGIRAWLHEHRAMLGLFGIALTIGGASSMLSDFVAARENAAYLAGRADGHAAALAAQGKAAPNPMTRYQAVPDDMSPATAPIAGIEGNIVAAQDYSAYYTFDPTGLPAGGSSAPK